MHPGDISYHAFIGKLLFRVMKYIVYGILYMSPEEAFDHIEW